PALKAQQPTGPARLDAIQEVRRLPGVVLAGKESVCQPASLVPRLHPGPTRAVIEREATRGLPSVLRVPLHVPEPPQTVVVRDALLERFEVFRQDVAEFVVGAVPTPVLRNQHSFRHRSAVLVVASAVKIRAE